jgi:hypothetical protein
MVPKTKQAIQEVALETGIDPQKVFGPNRSLTPEIVDFRRRVIAKLYDPASAGPVGSRRKAVWGVSYIGRQLDMHYTTILHHVKVMGIHPGSQP